MLAFSLVCEWDPHRSFWKHVGMVGNMGPSLSQPPLPSMVKKIKKKTPPLPSDHLFDCEQLIESVGFI